MEDKALLCPRVATTLCSRHGSYVARLVRCASTRILRPMSRRFKRVFESMYTAVARLLVQIRLRQISGAATSLPMSMRIPRSCMLGQWLPMLGQNCVLMGARASGCVLYGTLGSLRTVRKQYFATWEFATLQIVARDRLTSTQLSPNSHPYPSPPTPPTHHPPWPPRSSPSTSSRPTRPRTASTSSSTRRVRYLPANGNTRV